MCLYYYNHSRLLVVVNLLCSLLTPLSQESFHTVKKLLVRFSFKAVQHTSYFIIYHQKHFLKSITLAFP
jgi:hypothetical protein